MEIPSFVNHVVRTVIKEPTNNAETRQHEIEQKILSEHFDSSGGGLAFEMLKIVLGGILTGGLYAIYRIVKDIAQMRDGVQEDKKSILLIDSICGGLKKALIPSGSDLFLKVSGRNSAENMDGETQSASEADPETDDNYIAIDSGSSPHVGSHRDMHQFESARELTFNFAYDAQRYKCKVTESIVESLDNSTRSEIIVSIAILGKEEDSEDVIGEDRFMEVERYDGTLEFLKEKFIGKLEVPEGEEDLGDWGFIAGEEDDLPKEFSKGKITSDLNALSEEETSEKEYIVKEAGGALVEEEDDKLNRVGSLSKKQIGFDENNNFCLSTYLATNGSLNPRALDKAIALRFEEENLPDKNIFDFHPTIVGTKEAWRFIESYKESDEIVVAPYIVTNRVFGEDHAVLLAVQGQMSMIIDPKFGWFLGNAVSDDCIQSLWWQAPRDNKKCGFFVFDMIEKLAENTSTLINSLDDLYNFLKKLPPPDPKKIESDMVQLAGRKKGKYS